jgi:PASTA domain/WD40-like Beta Propeller Repeat
VRKTSLVVGCVFLTVALLLAATSGAEAASLPSLIAFDYHEGIGIVRPGHPGSEHVIARRTGRSAWSPNGEVLAFTAFDPSWEHGSMVLMDRAEDRIETIPVSVGDYPTWAPNGREIAYLCADGPRYKEPPIFPGAPEIESFNICVVDVISGVSRVLATGNEEFFISPSSSGFLSWSPRGDSIVTEDIHSDEPCTFAGIEALCGQDEVDAVDAVTGAWRRVITTPSAAPAYSPNGKKLAYRDQQGIHVASASGANPRLVSHLVPSTLSWAPDSKDLVISYSGPPANDGNNDLFELSLPSGRLKQYTNTGDDETDPSWAQAVTRCTVPRLKGKSPKQAKRLIALAGCELGKVTGRRKGKKRKVVKQSPAANSNVPVGTKVKLKFR